MLKGSPVLARSCTAAARRELAVRTVPWILRRPLGVTKVLMKTRRFDQSSRLHGVAQSGCEGLIVWCSAVEHSASSPQTAHASVSMGPQIWLERVAGFVRGWSSLAHGRKCKAGTHSQKNRQCLTARSRLGDSSTVHFERSGTC